jgi:hypothetical protein
VSSEVEEPLRSSPEKDLEPRLEALEKEVEALRGVRRQLELEWEDTSQRLRSSLGRLDKHAAKQGKVLATAEGAPSEEMTDGEILRTFGRGRNGGASTRI